MKIPFWKVESIGNNFVLVHLDDVSLLGENGRESELLTVLAVAACEKRYGIGSDGLLAVSQDGDGTLILRMFNPDGTEDFCGNGIRCAFDHALRQGWLAPGEMRMTHFGIPVSGSAQHLADHAKGSLSAIRHAMHRTPYLIHTQLPPASYRPEDIPIAREREIFDSAIARVDGEVYTGSVLSTGTAHTILPVRTLPHDEEFFRVSPQIERDPLFPERTSVMWVHEL
ncbi:MAG TPA: hypothetical protein VMI31_10425, partial [Fimbriimonadaceae bacterium]|nr:hypothetical protein [Fimbriimonadaceae bacterium]